MSAQDIFATASLRNNLKKLLGELNAGKDINEQSVTHMPLLNQARYQLEITELLIMRGADVNIVDKDNMGETPLISAMKAGNGDILKLLLQNKADINDKSYLNSTPVEVAVLDNNISHLKILLAHNPDPSILEALLERDRALRSNLRKVGIRLSPEVRQLLEQKLAELNAMKEASSSTPKQKC